jgi:hypothetical protein
MRIWGTIVLSAVLALPLRAQTTRIVLEPAISGLSMPVYFTSAKDGRNRRFVIEQVGRIRVLQPGSSSFSTFLDISGRVLFGGERGLLGLAFHPQFSTNRRFYVNYTRRPDGATVVAEYRASAGNANVADTAETVLFTIPQPFENHNGGMIDFGPDGRLYVGMGDGGAGNDPGNRAQNSQELLGKMLRVDVDGAPNTPSIFAFGFRNPWRWSFDRLTGQLYVGDVGQDAREEIDIVTSGGNYGWRVWEGTRCTNLGPAPCSSPGFIPPIIDYQNTGSSGRCSVIGGYVYRGTQASLPYGAYVYADLCSGEIFMLKDGLQTVLLDTAFQISSFGEDEAGEVYVVNIGGSISRITNPDQVTASSRAFSIPAGGTFISSTAGSAAGITAGYARVQADNARPLPGGLAIFGFRPRGVLVSEMTVPISPLMTSARIFAEVSGSVNTGVAFANPNDGAVAVSFSFTDINGTIVRTGSFGIPANQQIAAFFNEAPFNIGDPFFGTFTYSSNGSVSAIALRGVTNERSEFLMTTLPVVQAGTPVNPGTLAHFADGGGWKTQVVLMVPSASPSTGLVQFLGQNGDIIRSEPFAIAAGSAVRLQTEGAAGNTQTGSVRVLTTTGPPPAAISIFTSRINGVTVTEASTVAQLHSTAFQLYAELSGTSRTGFAIANPSTAAMTVTLSLPGRTASVDIPANGQRALFLNEIPEFASLPLPFQGMLALSSPAPFAVTGLRGRTNERGEFLITTTAAFDESAVVASSELLFPQFADGGGYSTQFVLFGRSTSGTIYFFSQSGQPKPLLFQ